MTMELDTILCGDSLDVLKALPESSVHCCVTSPPYYGLRDYGMDAQIGREATPEEYISRLTAVFREVRRVLRPDGTLWVLRTAIAAQAARAIPATPNIRRDATGRIFLSAKRCGAASKRT